ncbi:hypothetical protein BDP27DRAFT_108855 [Rhodocollybia butyracea]|uniref:DUF6534 domain-containing protein n=1 Tax=Rhodocollybia butyracea TaxID=206335 RepID=A0A9P5PGL6_9AGAR|nr:hypothetical protein BDP27DRAFT_108855 [Rhodocollybia butyracea]
MEPSPATLFAPLLIGTLLNAILLGVTSLQTLYYFQTYKNDPWWFKLLISYLMVAELANTAFDIDIVYESLITRYGSLVPVNPQFLPADAMTTALISTPVQLFMAWRIKKMTKSTVLCAIVTFAALCSLGGGVWLSISSINNSPFSHSPTSLPGVPGAPGALVIAPVVIWLASSGVTDLLITLIIAASMLRKRRQHRTTFDPYINRVIRPGAVTALAVFLDLTIFLSLPGSTIFFIWDLTVSKLYTNSLLTSLNSRPVKGFKEANDSAQNAIFPHTGDTTLITLDSFGSQIPDAPSISQDSIGVRAYLDPPLNKIQAHQERSGFNDTNNEPYSSPQAWDLEASFPRDGFSKTSSFPTPTTPAPFPRTPRTSSPDSSAHLATPPPRNTSQNQRNINGVTRSSRSPRQGNSRPAPGPAANFELSTLRKTDTRLPAGTSSTGRRTDNMYNSVDNRF